MSKVQQKNQVAKRPDPTDQERTTIALATERVRERAVPPAVLAEWKPSAVEDALPHLNIRPAHADAAGWCQQLKDTFGTASADFASVETDRLVSALGLREEEPAEGKINAALAALTGAQPRDETEAMLSSQMVATHSLIMDLLGRAKRADGLQLLEAYGGLANRLMRAYAIQSEAFAKLRRGNEQVVRVEHVHIYAGGQAVVGNVNSRVGGRRRNGRWSPTQRKANTSARLPTKK